MSGWRAQQGQEQEQRGASREPGASPSDGHVGNQKPRKPATRRQTHLVEVELIDLGDAHSIHGSNELCLEAAWGQPS